MKPIFICTALLMPFVSNAAVAETVVSTAQGPILLSTESLQEMERQHKICTTDPEEKETSPCQHFLTGYYFGLASAEPIEEQTMPILVVNRTGNSGTTGTTTLFSISQDGLAHFLNDLGVAETAQIAPSDDGASVVQHRSNFGVLGGYGAQPLMQPQ